MRNQLKIVYSALTIVAMLGLTSTVHGIPSFARQTGLDCNSCHSAAGYPTLNTFGQAFKAGGFTQASEDNLMGDGEALSIPKTLGMAVVAKLRYTGESSVTKGLLDTTTNIVDNTKVSAPTTSNEVNMPDEWAIWLTGRAGKHIGFATEFNGEGVLSFKMPIVYDIGPLKAGVVPYWTDAQGAGWGFETLSTGAVGNIKLFEGGANQSARMYLGYGGAATGLGVYVWHPMGFVYYSAYVPGSAKISLAVSEPSYAHYLRAAITPSVAGIDIAAGVQYAFGNTTAGKCSGTIDGVALANPCPNANGRLSLSRENFLGIDAQVMGTIGIPMALVFTWGTVDTLKDTAGKAQAGIRASATTILLNATLIEDLINLGAGIRLGVIEGIDKAGAADGTQIGNVKASDNKITDNALIAELKFNIARNMRLSLTGYMDLGTPDVADAAGATVLTTTTTKTSALRVMLFGAF